jgi:hypothetical protein
MRLKDNSAFSSTPCLLRFKGCVASNKLIRAVLTCACIANALLSYWNVFFFQSEDKARSMQWNVFVAFQMNSIASVYN